MKKLTNFFLYVSALFLLITPSFLFAQTLPFSAFSFSQLDYVLDGDTIKDSNMGLIEVNVDSLTTLTGQDSGYINFVTPLGWVIQNLPISKDYPYHHISTTFLMDSLSGVDISFVNGDLYFDPIPLLTAPIGTFNDFYDAREKIVNASGFAGVGTGMLSPAIPGFINFLPGGLNKFFWQSGHKNEETADDQCLPMSCANSLQWLEDTYENITIPDEHKAGLGADGSLVGDLEDRMGRNYVDRRNGDPVGGVDGLNGKLEYLAANNIKNIKVKHMGSTPGALHFGTTAYSKTSGGVTVTSTALASDTITFEALLKEIEEGEDVELGFLWAGGGHFVEVVGAGLINGVPVIGHMSDHNQSNDSLGTKDRNGNPTVDVSILLDTDGDGNLNLFGSPWSGANLAIFYSESPMSTNQIFPLIPEKHDDLSLSVSPNPLSEFAKITFLLPENDHVHLDLYDQNGRYIRSIWDRHAPGEQIFELEMNVSNMATGVYYLRIFTAKGKTDIVKMIKEN